ncbi:hypothetical protein Hanom_Chr16g01475761 [Helianthus anomalus]
MKYVGDFKYKNEIKRNGLTRDWRFILHVFAMSLAHRKGGYDGLNLEWSAAMLNLCTKQPFNISCLIFYCMVDNANMKTWAMYPRFVQLLINDQCPKLPHDDYTYKFHLPTSRQITELKTNEWVMLHQWMYRNQRLPLVKATYEKYRDGVKRKKPKDVEEEADDEEEEEEEQLIRKNKGKQPAEEGELSKKKKDTPNPERLMGDSIRLGETREHR